MNRSPALLAKVLRSGRVESEHYGHLVVANPEGEVILSFGEPETRTYMRSAAKPFQAITTLRLGCGEHYRWSAEEVAVVCASHVADDEHLRPVRSILAKGGLTPDDLLCGPHPPICSRPNHHLIRSHLTPLKLHNNCSGKHAGMLAACRLMQWPITTYTEASHPLQQENLVTMAEFAGLGLPDLATGIDGCGVPSFYLSLRGMATAFARLAESTSSEGSPSKQVFEALTQHPTLIAGEGRFNTLLNRFLGGKGIGKGGAEGVFGACLINPPLGIAVKLSDGSSRSHPAILASLLERYLPDLPWPTFCEQCNPPLRNTRGELVGQICAAT